MKLSIIEQVTFTINIKGKRDETGLLNRLV